MNEKIECLSVSSDRKFILDLKCKLITSLGNLVSCEDFKRSDLDFSKGLCIGQCDAFSVILKLILEYETDN